MDQPLSAAFSRYAVEFELPQLSAPDTEHLVSAFVNWVGCALAGALSPTVDTAIAAHLSLGPDQRHRPLGRGEMLGLADVVALDCLASSATAFDDAHPETVLHPTGPVAAALLGLARIRKVSGREYLTALHVGMEIECRTGLAFATEGTGAKRGWFSTGLAGGIGAAAAAGRVLGFDAGQMRNAFGLAAARAGGNRGVHGSMMSAYVPALAAESGLLAAMFTQAGFTCSDRAFDGPIGLVRLVASAPAMERALAGLGTTSDAARTTFKPYPSGIVTHQVIDACLALVREHQAGAGRIEALHLRVSQATSDLVARKHPKDTIQSQGSLYYWAAIALTFGAASVEHNTQRLVSDPGIASLQDRILVEVDAALRDEQCVATAILTDGSQRSVRIEHAVGSTARPMTREEVDAKFSSLVHASNSADQADRLREACRGILLLDDVGASLGLQRAGSETRPGQGPMAGGNA